MTDPADQRVFVLTQEQWDAFQVLLAAPPKRLPRLEKLLASTELWELPSTK